MCVCVCVFSALGKRHVGVRVNGVARQSRSAWERTFAMLPGRYPAVYSMQPSRSGVVLAPYLNAAWLRMRSAGGEADRAWPELVPPVDPLEGYVSGRGLLRPFLCILGGLCGWKTQGGQLLRVWLREREPLATLVLRRATAFFCGGCWQLGWWWWW